MSFRSTDVFEVQPPMGWGRPILARPVESPPKPSWADDEAKKKLYGIELVKHDTPFQAACEIFEDTSHALWASHHWIYDPVVIASKDAYSEAINLKLLDREQLARKLLDFANEKAPNGFPTVDAKDRLAAYKLYAEVQGFIGKVELNNSTNNYYDNRTMAIRLVKPNNDNKLIEASAEEQSAELKPIAGIKLVSSVR